MRSSRFALRAAARVGKNMPRGGWAPWRKRLDPGKRTEARFPGRWGEASKLVPARSCVTAVANLVDDRSREAVARDELRAFVVDAAKQAPARRAHERDAVEIDEHRTRVARGSSR